MDTTPSTTQLASSSNNNERAGGGGQTHWFAVFGAVFGAGLIAGAITLVAPLPAGDGADAGVPPATAQRPAS
jgi:hypothetical protein